MKTILLLACIVLLSGCSLFTQGPSEAKARSLEEGRAAEEREMAINARASQYEKTGLSGRDARAAAETEYAKSGAR